MRYRLRTLLIVLAVGPPLIAAGYWVWLGTQFDGFEIELVEEKDEIQVYEVRRNGTRVLVTKPGRRFPP